MVVSDIDWFDLDIRGCGDSHRTVWRCRNYLRKKTDESIRERLGHNEERKLFLRNESLENG